MKKRFKNNVAIKKKANKIYRMRREFYNTWDNEQLRKELRLDQFNARTKAILVANNLKALEKKYGKDFNIDDVSMGNFTSQQVKTAMKTVVNSEQFVSAAERSRNNLMEGIKKSYPDTYKNIRKLLRRYNQQPSGQYAGSLKINYNEQLEWDKDRRGYTFVGNDGKRYMINIDNSPEDIYIQEI